jgi:NAD-dependent SIR2 family protein deacetylase
MTRRVQDPPGPAWEKRGNTVWLGCDACGAFFPVSPSMLREDAPPCRCPKCHRQFRPAPDARPG